jgi:hypothetical protein
MVQVGLTVKETAATFQRAYSAFATSIGPWFQRLSPPAHSNHMHAHYFGPWRPPEADDDDDGPRNPFPNGPPVRIGLPADVHPPNLRMPAVRLPGAPLARSRP